MFNVCCNYLLRTVEVEGKIINDKVIPLPSDKYNILGVFRILEDWGYILDNQLQHGKYVLLSEEKSISEIKIK